MAQVLAIADIQSCVAQVAGFYDVKKVSLFGSYAQGKQTQKSDIDLLVEFKDNSKVTLFTLFDLQDELKELTGKNVDVIALPIPKDSILEIDKEIPIYG